MANKDKNTKDNKKAKKDVERPTNDELEILKLVINENPGLKSRVLKKIKSVRAAAQLTLFDSAATKEKGKKSSKNRRSRDDRND